MRFREKEVHQVEEIAKTVDRFGINIRGMTSFDLVPGSELQRHQLRGSHARAKALEGRFMVVKNGSERVLAKIEFVQPYVTLKTSPPVRVMHLTGSNAGKIVGLTSHSQMLDFPSFARVLRSLRRGQKGNAGSSHIQ